MSDKTPVDIKKHFEQMAAEYDDVIRQVVPHYDQMLDLVVRAIPETNSNIRVLDLGCGSGNLTMKLKACFDDATVIAADIAKDMVDLARIRLADLDQVEVVQADMLALPFEQNFDVVVSTLVLHHIADAAIKEKLFATLYRVLKPGGILCIGDIMLGETLELETLNREYWITHMQSYFSNDEIVNKWVPRHEATDAPRSVGDELRSLEAAGFDVPFVVWKCFNVAVYGGVKV